MHQYHAETWLRTYSNALVHCVGAVPDGTDISESALTQSATQIADMAVRGMPKSLNKHVDAILNADTSTAPAETP